MKPCEQHKITEARVQAERAIANTFQRHADAVGLSAWARRVIGTGDATWFGGVELSPAISTTALVSIDVQQIEPGLDRVVVCFTFISSVCTVLERLAPDWWTCHALQVTVPLTLTLTVPDQITADIFHTSTAEPPYRSPRDPNALATRADAAGLALSRLARDRAFHDIPVPKLAANLQLTSLQYPVVADASVSIIITAVSENFTAVRSLQVDTLQASLFAFAQAAVFELELALQALPDLHDAIQVRFQVFIICVLALRASGQVSYSEFRGNCLVESQEHSFVKQYLLAQCCSFCFPVSVHISNYKDLIRPTD
jgi:hypothetical protein